MAEVKIEVKTEVKTEPKEIDKHVDTVKVKNLHTDFIDMKHQRLQPGEEGLATIAEQEALSAFLKIT